MKILFSIFFVFALLVSTTEINAQTSTWRISKTFWSAQDEVKWQEFVQAIGEQVEQRNCWKVGQCLKLPANPYVGSDPQGFSLYSDCADLPYVLRGYFAWKNQLPFSVITSVKPKNIDGNERGDTRYNNYGNQPESRIQFVNPQGAVNAVEALINTIPNYISSAMFRINEIPTDAKTYNDFYPIRIQRSSLKPGTAIYDPNGHVAIVYKVTADGKVFYIDAHPDNSLTSGLFNPKFARSNPGQGAGFKNFRPLRLEGATQNSQGYYQGGRIVAAMDSELSDYSQEQFYGNDYRQGQRWNEGAFVFNGQKVNYYDYIRNRLSVGALKINPVEDLKTMVKDICVSLKDRVYAVDAAIKVGIQNKSHPERLPYNIYGTNGEWENYSTPSRDARLKVSYKDLLDQTVSLLQKYQAHDPSIQYSGGNLKADLLQAYEQESQACVIQYQNSAGQMRALNLEQARQRLFDMSFDPYHCVELRWGATSQQELSTCTDSAEKYDWFAQERWLRNQIERRYDARMDFSLNELTGPLPNVGVLNPPDTDVKKYLK